MRFTDAFPADIMNGEERFSKELLINCLAR